LRSSDPNDQSTPHYLEPELHFSSKKIAVAGSQSDEKVTVTQFIRKGAVLADFPDYLSWKKKGYLRYPLQAGEGVEFREDIHALVAAMSGYPRTNYLEQEEGPDLLTISIIPFIKISHNKMQASFVLHPVIADAPSLKEENLTELIEEAGVTAGIDESGVQQAQKLIDDSCDDFVDIPFAQGVFPGEGEDASLHFELEIGPLAGHLLADGTIDFRDRRIMVGVNKGCHIATKIPAVQGKEGYNVLGEVIEPKSGKDITVKVQGDATFLAEENRVIATADGAMSVVNNDTIKVTSKSTIKGDVDYNTGNIESENHIIINGSVRPGFKVNAGGDLEISGAVSSASIHSNGNLVIKGGITGQSSMITSGGDLDIHFIERGVIKSGGLVVIRKQCYYSSIEAASDIRCHKSSSILGGTLLAGGNLTVGNVGADNCAAATLGAGVDPGRYLLYRQLQKELQQQQEEIIQTLQLLGRGARPKKIRKMEEVALETKMKLLKLNLIPGTELYSRVGSGKERDELEEEDPLYLQNVDIENIRIEVYGKMYAGTKILLGNRTATLSGDVEKKRYRLSKNLKRIMVIPL
jgi:uncharacterized protein